MTAATIERTPHVTHLRHDLSLQTCEVGLIREAATRAAATALLTLSLATITLPAQADPLLQRAAAIPTQWEAFGACVSERESHGNYKAINRDEKGHTQPSSARGRWQFLQDDWGKSLAYMVAARLKAFGMPAADARKIRIVLQHHTIDRWKPIYQDIGFIAVILAKRTGWHHWKITGSRCNHLAVQR